MAAHEFINSACESLDGFLSEIGHNQRNPEYANDDVNRSTTTPLIGADSSTWSSTKSILTSYIIPREYWLRHPTADLRKMWVTPRIPPTVSLDAFDAIEPNRFAYVREWNWEKSGVRGLFAISHWGRGRFNYHQLIGKPVSPSLYTYLNNSMGMAETNFLIFHENAYWMSAVIGGFDPAHNSFYVHYNDDGNRYAVLTLPYDVVAEYVRKYVPANVQLMSWSTSTTTLAVIGDNTPFGEIKSTTKATEIIAPETPINEGFYGIDMKRFWPQFMTALEMALFSPISSVEMFHTLSQLPHWTALEYYFKHNQGRIPWIPPTYAQKLRADSLGNFTKPNYMIK